MPAKTTRRYKKKTTKRKPKSLRSKTDMVRMRNGFPDRISTKLKYVERAVHVPGLAVFSYLFGANNMYDPRTATGGHQPAYFDQYAAIYKRYIVTGCKIQVDINNASTASMMDCVILHSDTDTAFTSAETIYEQSAAYKSAVAPISQQYPTRLTYYVDIAKSFGVSRRQLLSDDTFQATTGGSPARNSFIHCFYASTNNSDNIVINAIYKLTYYCQFFDRLDIAGST